jgi:hypothetical protein
MIEYRVWLCQIPLKESFEMPTLQPLIKTWVWLRLLLPLQAYRGMFQRPF